MLRPPSPLRLRRTGIDGDRLSDPLASGGPVLPGGGLLRLPSELRHRQRLESRRALGDAAAARRDLDGLPVELPALERLSRARLRLAAPDEERDRLRLLRQARPCTPRAPRAARPARPALRSTRCGPPARSPRARIARPRHRRAPPLVLPARLHLGRKRARETFPRIERELVARRSGGRRGTGEEADRGGEDRGAGRRPRRARPADS